MSEPERPSGDHPDRVHRAFDALDERLGDRPTGEERAQLERLREAAAAGDAAAVRDHLAQVKERHGWIHDEMARHPDLAALINELALFGL